MNHGPSSGGGSSITGGGFSSGVGSFTGGLSSLGGSLLWRFFLLSNRALAAHRTLLRRLIVRSEFDRLRASGSN
jgi:hypothetical protein